MNHPTPNAPSRWYRTAASLAVPLAPLFLRNPYARKAHADRLASTARLTAWGNQRDKKRALAWFHAASVGEGLQAESVINAFRASHPYVMVIFTHFSPSAERLAGRLDVEYAGYLPYDRFADMTAVLDAVGPDLLVFAKLDLWPEMACYASDLGIEVAIVAGTVEEGSSRLRWPARTLIRPGYRAVNWAGAIAPGDASRLAQLGVPPEHIAITGDPRIDSALLRVEQPHEKFWRLGSAAPPLIAGSTWPADEAMLLAAFVKVRAARPDATLVIAPHEPTTDRLHEIASRAVELALPHPRRLSTISTGIAIPPLVLVDRLGVLADLYALGGCAYVGGGYGTRGIHSVLEPAAAGRAVVIGPHDRGSRDAQLLDSAAALFRLPESDASGALAEHWLNWLNAPDQAAAAGTSGREALIKERGAAQRSADKLGSLLPPWALVP